MDCECATRICGDRSGSPQQRRKKVTNNLRNYKLMIISLLLLSAHATAVRGDCLNCQYLVPTLMNLFEEGLVNNDDNLFNLRKLYFNPSYKYSPVSVCLQVTVTLDDIADAQLCCPDDKAFNDDMMFQSVYEVQLSNGDSGTWQLSDLLTTSGITAVFFTFDPTFYTTMKALSNSFTHEYPLYEMDGLALDDTLPYAEINIYLPEHLETIPCWCNVDEALRLVFVWARAYARTNGSRQYYQQVDRSSVSVGSKNDIEFDSCKETLSGISLTNPQNGSILVICIFILSNLLVLSSTVLYFRKMFLWLQQKTEQIKTLYKATAVVLTFVNVLVLALDIYSIIRGLWFHIITKDLDFAVFFLPGKALLVLGILILETPVVCFNTHQLNQNNQMNKKRYRIAHAFASCQIIWFVHRLVTDMIISIVFFIIAPAQTLGVVTLLLFTLASAIAFVAIMMHKGCRGCNGKTCTFFFCTALNGIMICALLFVITLLYIMFVDNGLRSAGMGGLILSLVPPFSMSVIGFIVKQKLSTPTNSSTSGNTTEASQQPLLRSIRH